MTMTDWGKLKVTDLKEECKSRGIPLTGLKLKQQYVDKLAEYEVAQGTDDTEEPDTAHVTPPEESQVATPENEASHSEPDSQSHSKESTNELNIPEDNPVLDQDLGVTAIDENKSVGVQDGPAGSVDNVTDSVSAQEAAEEDKPAEVQKEDLPTEDVHQPLDTTPAARVAIDKESVFIPESNPVHTEDETIQRQNVEDSEQMDETDSHLQNLTTTDNSRMASDNASEQNQDAQSTVQTKSAPLSSDTSTPTSSQIPATDLQDDRRNRRKRSLTPVPTSEEMSRKKARLSGDAEDVSEQSTALEEIKAATQVAKEIRSEDTEENPRELLSKDFGHRDNTTAHTHRKSVSIEMATEKTPPISPSRLRDLSEERDVPPAIHPATSSIYIRNLKRPLHIPTLRNHIVSVAQSPDPITVFFLDSIRTHAFISFTSVAAASRVRTAMHDTRFPDEAMREPLFVDYIPDDKVQSWIDQETGGNSFGGRAGGKRFEVVYEESRHGDVEAIFQEVDTRNPQPPLSRPSLTSRASIDIGRPRLESLSQELHPDRTTLVSNPSRHDRAPLSRPSAPSRPSNTGVGFKALDDLFSSTTTKPKLYFKPVPDDVVQDRMSMLRDLRVDHSDMGRSGDEGMKRYSFEQYKGGREEWVDKGPEFGFGRKGQDRLTGYRGRGGGGYRGRGGDSWRGGR
jgi:hypothetical protein